MKSTLAAAVLFLILAFLQCATVTVAQESREVTATNTSSLPDAPSSVHATTCTKNNGKPCAERIHWLIGQYPPIPDSQIPDHRDEPATFWTYRGALEPPLRTSKQVFHSKLFLLAHAGEVAAMVAACRNKNSGEDWGQGIPLSAGLVALDYFQFRFIGGPNAIGLPIAMTIYYGRESTR